MGGKATFGCPRVAEQDRVSTLVPWLKRPGRALRRLRRPRPSGHTKGTFDQGGDEAGFNAARLGRQAGPLCVAQQRMTASPSSCARPA